MTCISGILTGKSRGQPQPPWPAPPCRARRGDASKLRAAASCDPARCLFTLPILEAVDCSVEDKSNKSGIIRSLTLSFLSPFSDDFLPIVVIKSQFSLSNNFLKS